MTRQISQWISAVALFCFFFAVTNAIAEPDLTGRWRVVLQNQDQSVFRIEIWQLTSASDFQSVTGTVAVSSDYGGQTGTISGSYDGDLFLSVDLDNVQFDTFYTSRTTTETSMSGEWYQSQTDGGTFMATKLRASEVSLSCQRGPTKDDDLVCTSIVSAVDQQSPAPIGTITFSAETGTFPSGSQCSTVASTDNSYSASCGIAYRPTDADAAAKTPPVIVATYVEDDIFQSDSNDGVTQDVAFVSKAKPSVCFDTTEQPCAGVNTVLPTNLRKSGLGKITLGYFAPTTGSDSAMINVRSLVRRARAFSAPRSKRDISIQVTYTLKPSENPWYRAAVPRAVRELQPKSGVVMGSKTATVKFGQMKEVPIKLPSPAKKVVSSAITAQVPQATVRVRLNVLRKGDKRPRSFFQPYVVNFVLN